MKKGVRWGIGNGENVCILSYQWIPSTPQQLLHPILPIPANAKAKCLIEDSGSWNVETVRAFFRDNIASEILCLPINKDGEEDFARPLTKYGEYSVRSAYNMARSVRVLESCSTCGTGQCSNRQEEKSWKAILSIKVPKKMKVALWHFAHDCLPSGAQLQQRHVPDS